MFNAFEEIFAPGRKHTDDERNRLALTRVDVGDGDPGRGPIDLASGKVTVRAQESPSADEGVPASAAADAVDTGGATDSTDPAGTTRTTDAADSADGGRAPGRAPSPARSAASAAPDGPDTPGCGLPDDGDGDENGGRAAATR